MQILKQTKASKLLQFPQESTKLHFQTQNTFAEMLYMRKFKFFQHFFSLVSVMVKWCRKPQSHHFFFCRFFFNVALNSDKKVPPRSLVYESFSERLTLNFGHCLKLEFRRQTGISPNTNDEVFLTASFLPL